jgi:2'-5' RNA ligase
MFADYMPHMSLLYGDLDAAVRDQIVQEVKAQHADLLVDSEFLVRSFHLYRTDPSDLLMKTWTKIAEFPLQGRQEKAGAT